MKQLSVLALAALSVLSIGLVSSWAQNPLERGKSPASTVPIGLVYTGHSADGDLQEALNDALARAQQGIADSAHIADMTFSWDLTAIRGTRGGIMGLQDVWVDVAVR